MTTDFKITYDGTWYHEGAPIKREALAKLFADRALKIDEAGQYWLKTPYEQYAVDVEDVPFVVKEYAQQDNDIHFTTNMNDTVICGPDHPLELRNNIPYIEVRNGLYARISRPVFYHLIEEFGAEITSQGMKFKLGETDD